MMPTNSGQALALKSVAKSGFCGLATATATNIAAHSGLFQDRFFLEASAGPKLSAFCGSGACAWQLVDGRVGLATIRRG